MAILCSPPVGWFFLVHRACPSSILELRGLFEVQGSFHHPRPLERLGFFRRSASSSRLFSNACKLRIL
jgi:hypothetical protein